ncbi:hypothetical protein G6F38_005830 [Rhizopus arrhizus]|nr:hypothetical protein G6F38_005830 [Rhizopus arrhizus]
MEKRLGHVNNTFLHLILLEYNSIYVLDEIYSNRVLKIRTRRSSKTPVWQRCCTSSNIESLNIRQFNLIFKDFRLENLQKQRDATNSVLISACRPTLSVDPILWLPMSPAERSRLVRWRLGWLPGGVPKPCIYHPNDLFTRSHSIRCLHMHRRLQMPLTEPDPLSFLLNKLPTKKQQYGIASRRPDPHRFSAWKIR